MPVNVTDWIAAGYEYGFYSQLDTDGYANGGSGSIVAGSTTGSPSIRIKGVQTADLSIPEPETVPVPGDDGTLGAFLFASTDVPSGNIEVGVFSLTDLARFQATNVVALGNLSTTPIGPKTLSVVDLALVFSRQAKSQMPASSGKAGYENLLILKAQAFPLWSAGYQGRTAAVNRYRVIINPSNGTPLGFTMSESVYGEEIALALPFMADYPMHLHPFLGNNTQDVFTTTFTPATTTLLDHLVYVEGIRQTSGVTINTANKTFTFAAPPANNARIEIFYQFRP